MSEESTACAAPSSRVTDTPVTGAPMSAPLASIERKPFSTAEMNSLGMAPPLISSAKRKGSSVHGSMKPVHLAVLAGAAGLLLVRVADSRRGG